MEKKLVVSDVIAGHVIPNKLVFTAPLDKVEQKTASYTYIINIYVGVGGSFLLHFVKGFRVDQFVGYYMSQNDVSCNLWGISANVNILLDSSQLILSQTLL